MARARSEGVRAKVVELRTQGIGPTEIAMQLGISMGWVGTILWEYRRANPGVSFPRAVDPRTERRSAAEILEKNGAKPSMPELRIRPAVFVGVLDAARSEGVSVQAMIDRLLELGIDNRNRRIRLRSIADQAKRVSQAMRKQADIIDREIEEALGV